VGVQTDKSGNDDIDPVLTEVSNVATQEIKENHHSSVVLPKSRHKLDVGVLNPPSTCPTDKVIKCTDGKEESTGCTRDNACDVQCCVSGKVGALACDGFTGSICKDGVSCTQPSACSGASISSVYHGCVGFSACKNAGAQGGEIGEINSSCHGMRACYGAASESGKIGKMIYIYALMVMFLLFSILTWVCCIRQNHRRV